jgi:hypothetical protein
MFAHIADYDRPILAGSRIAAERRSSVPGAWVVIGELSVWAAAHALYHLTRGGAYLIILRGHAWARIVPFRCLLVPYQSEMPGRLVVPMAQSFRLPLWMLITGAQVRRQ